MNLNEAQCTEGGMLRELYKASGYGQLTLRTIPVGEQTEPHVHWEHNEWWLVVRGEALIYTKHDGIKSTRRVIGNVPVVIPVLAGTAHAIENVGKVEVVLLFHSDRIYDPKNPDKEPVRPWM